MWHDIVPVIMWPILINMAEIDNLSIILPKSALITCNYAWCNLWEVSITMKIIFFYTHIIYISLIGFSRITNWAQESE